MILRLATLLMFFSVTAEATLLSPFTLNVPLDPGTVKTKCNLAYEQLLADLKQKETHEGFQCYVTLTDDNKQAILGGFMDQCYRTVRLRADAIDSGKIVVDLDAINKMFDGTYRGLVFSECAPREAQRISNYNSQQQDRTYSNTGSSGGGGGMREGCYYTNSCY